jgi:hypothetical protein
MTRCVPYVSSSGSCKKEIQKMKILGDFDGSSDVVDDLHLFHHKTRRAKFASLGFPLVPNIYPSPDERTHSTGKRFSK